MAIPKQCKRLAEVDFPIASVGTAVLKREKKFPVPRGLPSTLHQWWARRPLGSSRAMLLALLLPDPCDPLCPAEFKIRGRQALQGIVNCGCTDEDLRKALLSFTAAFACWENTCHRAFLDASRALVRASTENTAPLVLDTFSGGGAIPLEALRLGCEALAIELNPVAGLILRVLLEGIPRSASQPREIEHVVRDLVAAVSTRLAACFRAAGKSPPPAAYLWVRTVRCEAPQCGAGIPLTRAFWIAKNGRRRIAIRATPTTTRGERVLTYELFEPSTDTEVQGATVKLARATCIHCDRVLPAERVRAQLRNQRGGARVIFDARGERAGGARLWAVIEASDRGRRYRLPTSDDYRGVLLAQEALDNLIAKIGPQVVPNESTPQDGTGSVGGGYRTRKYGIESFGDFFTGRQAFALAVFAAEIARLRDSGCVPETVPELLALALDKVADFGSSLSRWRAASEDIGNAFGRQALPIVWDFAELNPLHPAFVSFARAVGHAERVVSFVSSSVERPGQVALGDAQETGLPSESVDVFFTDPPYYDAVPYADLSDFFFVWLKRCLPGHPILRDPTDPTNALTPKLAEIARDEVRHLDRRPRKDACFYEAGMGRSFREGRRVLKPGGIGCVIFAHKTTEGWEALLSGLVRGGWTITASWPISTEMGSRLRARASAALATSVHLICRPRPDDAAVGDWGQVLRELPKRVGDWMERLQDEGIRGADLVFACIGPALEIFSRYSSVETADGREVKLPEYLEKVWEVVGRTALEHIRGTAEARARNGAASALEEDARLTALFL